MLINRCVFSHEKLRVYRLSVEYLTVALKLAEKIRDPDLRGQMKQAAMSMPLNIAEGAGKLRPMDKNRYFATARGSALESAAALDVACATNDITVQEADMGKDILRRIAGMLTRLGKLDR